MKNEKALNFELSGVKFRGDYLTPERSLDAFALLSPCLSNVLEKLDPSLLKASAQGDEEAKAKKLEVMAKVLGQSLAQFRDLPKIRPFFLPQYEALLVSGEQRVWMPLTAVESDVFGGKALLMVAFLVAAIQAEYGDFLRTSGLRIFKDLAAVFGFRLASPDAGQSGA